MMKNVKRQTGRIPLGSATRSTRGLGIQGDEEVGFPRTAGITRN